MTQHKCGGNENNVGSVDPRISGALALALCIFAFEFFVSYSPLLFVLFRTGWFER